MKKTCKINFLYVIINTNVKMIGDGKMKKQKIIISLVVIALFILVLGNIYSLATEIKAENTTSSPAVTITASTNSSISATTSNTTNNTSSNGNNTNNTNAVTNSQNNVTNNTLADNVKSILRIFSPIAAILGSAAFMFFKGSTLSLLSVFGLTSPVSLIIGVALAAIFLGLLYFEKTRPYAQMLL